MSYRTDPEHIAIPVSGRAVITILSGLGIGVMFWSALFLLLAS